MPIYEYVCQDCGQKYDKLVRSLSAQIELECPQCGSSQGEKALSMFGALGTNSTSQGSSDFAAAPSCGPIG